MEVKEERRKKLSTVETRPAIMQIHTVKGSNWVREERDETGTPIKEFENRSEAKAYFSKEFISQTDITATVYVKDETLEFIHKEPVVKAVKA